MKRLHVVRPSMSAAHVAKVFAQVEHAVAPTALVASWRRCINVHGLQPDGAARPSRRENAFVTQSRQRSEAMLRAAGETIDHLMNTLSGPDHMIFLTDANGVVLDTRSMRTGDFWNRPPGDWGGTDFSETSNGTNGIGTVLREQRPMTVAADEHFQVRDVLVICSGAPIYGLDGTIVGCLDISYSATRNDPLGNSLVLAAVVDGARRIETRMLSEAHPRAKLVLASQTGRHPGAFLAVDRSGGVVGATRSARMLLDLKPEHLTGNFSLEELWHIEDARDLSWLAGERRMIEVALVRHHGNASAAARTLGISRSTLNRKIADFQIGIKGPLDLQRAAASRDESRPLAAKSAGFR